MSSPSSSQFSPMRAAAFLQGALLPETSPLRNPNVSNTSQSGLTPLASSVRSLSLQEANQQPDDVFQRESTGSIVKTYMRKLALEFEDDHTMPALAASSSVPTSSLLRSDMEMSEPAEPSLFRLEPTLSSLSSFSPVSASAVPNRRNAEVILRTPQSSPARPKRTAEAMLAPTSVPRTPELAATRQRLLTDGDGEMSSLLLTPDARGARARGDSSSVELTPNTRWVKEKYEQNSPVKPFEVEFTPTKQQRIADSIVDTAAAEAASKGISKKYSKDKARLPIIQQYFDLHRATKQEKNLNIVIGLSGSGKSTTVVRNIQEQGEGAILIDSDEVKRLLPEFDGGKGALAVHAASASIAGKCLRQAMEQGDNIIYTTVCTKPDGVKELMDNAKKQGYTVKLHLAFIKPAIAAMRMFNRGINEHGFLAMSPEEILKAGYVTKENFELLKELADEYAIWDTEIEGGKLRRQVSNSRVAKEYTEAL